ncbi:MAG: hypothetical protein ACR2MY_12820 [Candidatus Dormibacteria bacterium]
MRTPVSNTVLGLVLAAALSGCGNPTAGTPGGGASTGTGTGPASPAAASSGGDNLIAGDPAVKACELLPKSQLESLLGETFSDGVPGPGNCKVYSDDGSGGTVYIAVGDWTAFKSAAQPKHPAPLAGTGDEALKADDNALFVRVGTRGLMLQFTAASEKDPDRLLAKGRGVAESLVNQLRTGSTGTQPTATPVP